MDMARNVLNPEDLAIARRTAVLSGLDDAALGRLLMGAGTRRVSRGEVLFVQGDPADAFYVVLDGWIKIYRMSQGGEEAIVAVFTKGQSFAEAAVFTGDCFPVSAEAVTEGRLIRISSANLIELIRQSPEISLAMLAATSRHLHMLVQQIEQLKAHTGAQRVAEFLSSLAPVWEGSCIIDLPYDKSLIAGRLGMKPESLSRAFARLRDLGVQVQQNTAAIQDVSRLREFAAEERGAAAQM
jgi:CRP-like cAMP-binding protein